MSDQEFTVAPGAKTGAVPAGAMLAAERERHKLSIEDVSAQLRLSPRQIMALESDDFSALPEAMITRGYIRNYARFLGVDAEPLLQAYRNHAASAEHYAISIPSANIPIANHTTRPWKPYFIISLAIVVLLGLWVAYVDYFPDEWKPQAFSTLLNSPDESTDEDGVNTPAELPPAQETETPVIPPMQESGAAAPAASGTEPGAQAPAEASRAAAATAVPTLKLTFNEDSWVSVTDATKTQILNETKTAGSEALIEGQPPFRVIIGNAAGSQLLYNGQPVDLVPHTRLNVARVTLE